MNKNQRDNWKFEVLAEILSALAKNPEIRENLIFKGALILNRHLNTQRKSLDIDSNLDSDFALQRWLRLFGQFPKGIKSNLA